ncbi:hypothetical protein L1887_62099 [Cichorium endivia]|nr:hypothetical protein L1887_62099 [Cichorium endivia]
MCVCGLSERCGWEGRCRLGADCFLRLNLYGSEALGQSTSRHLSPCGRGACQDAHHHGSPRSNGRTLNHASTAMLEYLISVPLRRTVCAGRDYNEIEAARRSEQQRRGNKTSEQQHPVYRFAGYESGSAGSAFRIRTEQNPVSEANLGRKAMSDHSSDEVGAAITARRWHSRATLAKPARPHPYARVRSSVERKFAHTHVAHSPVSSIPPLPGSSLVSSAQSPPALTARTVCHAPSQERRGWRFRLHQPLRFSLKAAGGAGWLADRARWLVRISAALEGGRAASLLGMTGAGCALPAGKYSRTCDAAAGPRRPHLGGVMWMHCMRLPRFPAATSLPARTGGSGNNGCTTSSRWQRLLEGNIKVCLCTQGCCSQTPGARHSSRPTASKRMPFFFLHTIHCFGCLAFAVHAMQAKAYVSLSMMKLIWLLPLEVAREIQRAVLACTPHKRSGLFTRAEASPVRLDTHDTTASTTTAIARLRAAVAAIVEPKWYPLDSQALRFCRRSASSAASALPVASSGSGEALCSHPSFWLSL